VRSPRQTPTVVPTYTSSGNAGSQTIAVTGAGTPAASVRRPVLNHLSVPSNHHSVSTALSPGLPMLPRYTAPLVPCWRGGWPAAAGASRLTAMSVHTADARSGSSRRRELAESFWMMVSRLQVPDGPPSSDPGTRA
jgi:hypothetical protein